ncbi:ankyrin [Aspergillus coremiiformis]|uniref:Ankyrin n=1 Tax=Aspergillus coremiiformis TaxID=138285 RepID=A0A5N6YSS9_9EURO|nr:ankyrin [Aspergillus coremiiformis]
MASNYNSLVEAFHLTCEAGDLPKTQEALATRQLTAEDLDKGLALATKEAHFDLVATLFDTGACVSDWAVASLPGRRGVQQHPSIVRQYLDHGLDANANYHNGIPILVKMRNPAYARELLSRGANPNYSDPREVTPLHRAIHSSSEEAISLIGLLLAHRAKLEPDLLFEAVAPRVPQGELITRFLLAKGLDPNTPSVKWGNPLNRAIHSARPKIVKILLDAGADPTGQSAHPQYRGVGPLQIVKNIQSPKLQQAILTLLQSQGIDVGGDSGVERAR